MTWLIGVAIGALMGVTGAGGGVLAVPALVFVAGLSMQQAAPIALVAVAAAAWVGAVEGLFRRVVRWRAAIVIASAAAPFAALGVVVAHRVPDLALRIAFIGVLCFVAWRLVRAEAQHHAHDHRPQHVAALSAATGRFIWTPRAALGFAGIGATMGFLSGLLGVGGGFVLVPLLVRLTPLNTAMQVATALFVTAMVTSFGAAVSALHGVPLSGPLAAGFAASLVAGMALGRTLARRLAEAQAKRLFLWLVLGVAFAMAIDVLRRFAA